MPPKMTEERRLALAVCLLSFGAEPLTKDSRGFTAVDHAERNGYARLALLIRHWSDTQVWRLLVNRRHSTHALLGDERRSLTTLPSDVMDLVGHFLVPKEFIC